MSCFRQRRLSLIELTFRRMSLLLLALPFFLSDMSEVLAQFGGGGGFGVNMVGGVLIDADGAIKDIRPQLRKELAGRRDQAASKVPKDLGDGLQLRKISLRTLQDALVVAADDAEIAFPRGPLYERIAKKFNTFLSTLKKTISSWLVPERHGE